MKDEIADILEDFAKTIRGFSSFEGFSPESVLLNYWECCIAKTARTLVKHGQKPDDLMYLLMGALYDIAPGDSRAKDDAVLKMALKCRITDPGSQQ